MSLCMVKARPPGQMHFNFLTGDGRVVRFRMYAIRFADDAGLTGEHRAQAFIDSLDVQGWEFKVVRA